MPIHRQTHTESVAALGAARLGMLAAGMDLPSAMRSSYDREAFVPAPVRHASLCERMASFKRLYPHLRPMFRHFYTDLLRP
jgi:xylulokinase